jgi:uncharacterized protein (TIGR00288 family)
MTNSVAVFVDGDNVPASYAGKIIRHARSVGAVVQAKVYGSQNALGNWQDAVSFQFVYSGSGKNATDVLIAVEATEYVITNPVQSVVLCSSDADFTHVARFIRARGTHVLGMGEEKTKPEMRHSCSEFRVLSCDVVAKPKQTHMSEMDRKIMEVIASHGKDKRSMRVVDLDPVMRREHGTQISKTPEKNWRNYFTIRSTLYDLDPWGPEAMVRFKPGFAS